ncbi:MAG: tetratricopeptide repeat protein [Pseudomonadota bacterium]
MSDSPSFSHQHSFLCGGVFRLAGWRRGLVVAVWMLGSMEAFGHGAYIERVGRLLVALEQHPEDGALRMELADTRCEHEEWRQALQELDEADRLAPGRYPTDFFRGKAYLVGGKPAAAKAALDRLIALEPANPPALALRARALAALGKPGEALADYRAAWTATARPEPDFVQEFSAALAASGLGEESLQVLVAGMEQVGAVPGLVQLALERETALGRFDAALARIDVLQKSAPRPEPWMARRAALLVQAGRTDDARIAWQALIDHLGALPNLERGSHAMSLLAEQARRELAALPPAAKTSAAKPGDHFGADVSAVLLVPVKPGSVHEEELSRANEQVAASPGEGKVWFQRSVLLLLDGEFTAALLDVEQAERLAPGKFFTPWVRGQALAGLGRLEEGRAVLDEFLAAHPDHAAGFAARARISNRLNQTAPALADYRRVLHAGANADVELVLEATGALAASGCAAEALDALTAVLTKLGPVPALTQRAMELEIGAGRFEAALAHVDDLQKLAPRPEPWMAKRASLLAQAGRAEDARHAWQALLTHLETLPNLQRGAPALRSLAEEAGRALAAR